MNDLYTQDGVIEKDVLWERYIPLVRHEALKLQVRLPASVELDDLVQAGGIGLLDALERFDASQGTAFTTYAVQRVRGAMLDELRARDWVPRSVRRQAREATKVMQQLEQALAGRRPNRKLPINYTLVCLSINSYCRIPIIVSYARMMNGMKCMVKAANRLLRLTTSEIRCKL